MQKKLIHTPEGVRDIYGEEFKRKIYIQNRLKKLINEYGYEDIQTPAFEFFDIFAGNIGTVPSKELYKFFDKEGNTLALRPDFTPSIARVTAKYFGEENMPLRFCYAGNTYNNTSDYQGRLKETTEIGAELIGDGSVDADVEILKLVIAALKISGLTDFQISIGNLEFYKGLCAEFKIDEEDELKLREMINDKNHFGTLDILDSLSLKDDVRDKIARLPEMFGGVDILDEAAGYVSNDRSLNAIKRLKEIFEILKLTGDEKYISFDLGMLSRYNYYTGIIFRAYTYGSGDAIIKGGRYDNLLSEFGRAREAVGFCIGIDQIMSVLVRQNISTDISDKGKYLLLYATDKRREAYLNADRMRNEGKTVIMMNSELFDEKEILDHAAEKGLEIVRI